MIRVAANMKNRKMLKLIMETMPASFFWTDINKKPVSMKNLHK
jgi:hypothetical protein